jgi:hypothetical protein
MSIVRIGLAETKDFADGYDAIFGKKEAPKKEAKPEETTATAEQTAAVAKPTADAK